MQVHGGICPENKIPSLAPQHHELWGLFQLMIPGLTRQSGYDYGAILIVFDMHGIAQDRRPALLAQCVTLIGVLDEARAERARRDRG